MENRYLDQHRQSQEDRYSIPSFGYYDGQWNALNSQWWCPELFPNHRSAFYKAEVALNCRQRKMNWVQREVASLEKKVICPDCFAHVVVHRSERELLEKVLAQHQSGIVVMEESPEPFRVKRGVIEELYYGQEFDEYGRQVSNNYYGFGSDLAAFQRVPFVSLEIIEFLKNLLLDDDRNPETVFEKRRYVQTVCEIFEVFESYESEKTAKSIWPDFDDRVYHLFESSFGLGFLAAEYKMRFPQEQARETGLKNAHAKRQKLGQKRRAASVKMANEILSTEAHLLADLPSLAKKIEENRLDEHRQKNGVYIGWEAISVHLRRALKEGKLRNF